MHLVAGGLVLLVLIAVMVSQNANRFKTDSDGFQTACLLRQRLARRRMWMPNLEKVTHKKGGMSRSAWHSVLVTQLWRQF